jgi:FkbM family methyltransferase
MYNGDLDKGYHLDQYIEKLLHEHFGIDKNGVFLDVGAYHPTIISNSYYFESEKNFKVICVEANPIMVELLKQHRKHVYAYAAHDTSNIEVEIRIVKSPYDLYQYPYGMAAATGLHAKETNHAGEDVKVMAKTLNDILSEAGVEGVDALSIDIEGHELPALNGLDFDKYKPKVCCIERNPQPLDSPFYFDLEKYMADRGYKFVERLHVDDFFIRIKE